MGAAPPSQRIPGTNWLAFTVGRRFLGAQGEARAGEAVEEYGGGEAKRDEHWTASLAFSSAVGTDLGKKASGSRGGGSGAAGAEECARGRLSVV